MTDQDYDAETDPDDPEVVTPDGETPKAYNKNVGLTGYVAPQCKARSKGSGEQCRQKAEAGATVCRFHGGAAPQVKRKAAIRLLELIDPAISTLASEMLQADKSSDRQRAANSILDRAGVPRATTTPDGEAAKDLLVERLRVIRAQQESEIIHED